MAIRKFLSFLLQTVMTGLAAAFLYVLLIDPDLLRDNSTVVEVIESRKGTGPSTAADTTPDATRNGPVSYADAVEEAVPADVNIHTAKIITHRVHPLLKDPVFVDAARSFAGMIESIPGDEGEKIVYAFRRAVARKPSDAEMRSLAELRESHGDWFSVAQVLLNLDEKITK